MVAVTCCTGGSTQVTSNNHRFVVHAFVVLQKLSGLNAVRLHVIGLPMAMAAGRRDVKRIDRGANIIGWANGVSAVTIGANCNLFISDNELLPVNAGTVLRQLVRMQRGVVLAHISRVRMALAAQFRNLSP